MRRLGAGAAAASMGPRRRGAGGGKAQAALLVGAFGCPSPQPAGPEQTGASATQRWLHTRAHTQPQLQPLALKLTSVSCCGGGGRLRRGTLHRGRQARALLPGRPAVLPAQQVADGGGKGGPAVGGGLQLRPNLGAQVLLVCRCGWGWKWVGECGGGWWWVEGVVGRVCKGAYASVWGIRLPLAGLPMPTHQPCKHAPQPRTRPPKPPPPHNGPPPPPPTQHHTHTCMFSSSFPCSPPLSFWRGRSHHCSRQAASRQQRKDRNRGRWGKPGARQPLAYPKPHRAPRSTSCRPPPLTPSLSHSLPPCPPPSSPRPRCARACMRMRHCSRKWRRKVASRSCSPISRLLLRYLTLMPPPSLESAPAEHKSGPRTGGG